jgi:hypothetical protein
MNGIFFPEGGGPTERITVLCQHCGAQNTYRVPKQMTGRLERNWHRGRFLPLEWEGSIILLLARIVTNVLLFFSPMVWLSRWRQKDAELWLVDTWLLLLTVMQIVALCITRPDERGLDIVCALFAVFTLIDILAASLRDFVGGPIVHEGFIGIRHPQRWLFATFLVAVQTVLSFAILQTFYGKQFNPTIEDPFTAFYFSTSTFTTLGYGDIHPLCWKSRMLVVAELFYFLLFLSLKLPVAVSLIKTKRTEL